MTRILIFWLLWLSAGLANAAVLEGVGHANIRENNLDQARAEARQAAMRDLALQYQARVSTRDTLENGELTHSHTELSSMAQVHNATIVDEYRRGNLLRVIVRAELSGSSAGSGETCEVGETSGLRNGGAFNGLPIVMPEHGVDPGLDEAGQTLTQALLAKLQAQGQVQVLGPTSLQLFNNLRDAPTSQVHLVGNHLTNVV